MSRTAPPARVGGIKPYIPSHGDLVVRDILADGNDISMENYRKSGHKRRPATMGGYRFGQLSMSSFFTRHNPHPRRVNHFKGLLDVPICTVNDMDSAKKDYNLNFPPNGYAQQMLGLPTECINVNSSVYPMDTLTGLHYFHPLKLPFGKRQPTAMPQEKKADIDPWRKELQDLAKAAGLSTESQDKAREEPRTRTSQYSAATGRLIPPPTKGLSRASSRAKTAQFINNVNTPGDILGQPNMEDEVMMMLCQILQTEDVQAVQSWLSAAGENEKSMVQELIKAAMTGKEEGRSGQYHVQEYMIGLDGLPMTPDIGTTIGDHVQNRLSTADDCPPIPEPSMRPPDLPGPDVEEVVARIEQFSPRISGRGSLPPINETAAPEPLINADTNITEKMPAPVQTIKTPKPLPSIPPKQQSFNKALENITRRTLESLSEHRTDPNLKKFTQYPLKTGGTVKVKSNGNQDADEIRLKLSSAADERSFENLAAKASETETVWKPQEALAY